MHGQQDDARREPRVGQRAGDGEAVPDGHAEVDDGHVGPVRERQLHGRATVVGLGDDDEPRVADDDPREALADDRMVIGDQDADLTWLHRLRPS